MSTLSQFTGGIKLIQRGTITMTSVSSATATLATAVNPAKTMLNLLGFVDSSSSTTNLGVPRIELTNATTITANRGTTAGTTVVSYEAVEFY